VLAILPGVRTSASAEAELLLAHEAGPFCVLEVGAERIPVHKASYWVSSAICNELFYISHMVYAIGVKIK